MLLNEWTNSAAEMLASFAQENHLATVVGTKTAGNVLGSQTFPVGHGYSLRVPVFGWFTWSNACLEGSGVTPDIVMEIGGERLSASADQQMLEALKIANSL